MVWLSFKVLLRLRVAYKETPEEKVKSINEKNSSITIKRKIWRILILTARFGRYLALLGSHHEWKNNPDSYHLTDSVVPRSLRNSLRHRINFPGQGASTAKSWRLIGADWWRLLLHTLQTIGVERQANVGIAQALLHHLWMDSLLKH